MQRNQDVESSPRSGRRGQGHLLSALLRAEVRATPQCRREAAPWTRGPGSGGKAGSRGFWARSEPLGARGPFLYHSSGLGCRGPGARGESAAGLPLGSGQVFCCLARPAYLHLCPFGLDSDPDPLLSSQVKTGTILATDDNPKSPHVAVCRPATLHSQPSAPPAPQVRAEASRLPLLLQSTRAAAPSLPQAAQILLCR